MRWLAGASGLALLGAVGCDAGVSSSDSTRSKQQSQAQPRAEPAHQQEPADVESEPVAWFTDEAAERGLVFLHDSGHRQQYYMPEGACGGAALVDIDGDGDLDAYLVQSGNLEDPPQRRPPNRMFRNDGRGRFEEITDWSGTGDRQYGMGVATGDYDNDGDTDLYVLNLGRNVLYRNDGAGRFTDVTESAGVGDTGFGSSAAFVDYDNDGDLDLFSLNYLYWTTGTEIDCRNDLGEPEYCAPAAYGAPTRDVLYRNEGDGTFHDVSEEAGINRAMGTGLGIVCGEFSGDQRIDIFIANDGMLNLLWVNQGDGAFVEEAMFRGCAMDQDGKTKAGMGVAAADIDEDGDEDLLVVNLFNETDSFYRNDGAYFSDHTALVGLSAVSRPFTRFGLAMIDFDNDSHLDVFEACGRVARHARKFSDDPYAEPNVLLRGAGDGKFEVVEPAGGTREPIIATSRAAAFGDIDNDGDVDILIANRDAPPHLLVNNVGQDSSWIAFRVVDSSGRDAFGATVRIPLGDRTLMRVVRTAYSYCAANDHRIVFGLGEKRGAQTALVTWPDGARERFDGLASEAYHTLSRGAGSAP